MVRATSLCKISAGSSLFASYGGFNSSLESTFVPIAVQQLRERDRC